MSNNNHIRNTDGLRVHAKSKSEAAGKRIDTAIRTLSFQNAAINFNSVAAAANVSKTTLYNNPDYRERIESLRYNTVLTPASNAKKNVVTDKSKDIILSAKNKRIAELESEVERLSCILKRRYAEEYDKF